MYLQHPLSQCTYNIHCPNVPTTSTVPNVPTTSTVPMYLQHPLSQCTFHNIHCPNVPTTSTVPMYLQHPLSQCTYNIHCPNVPTTSTAPKYLQHPLPYVLGWYWCQLTCHTTIQGFVSFGRHAKSPVVPFYLLSMQDEVNKITYRGE